MERALADAGFRVIEVDTIWVGRTLYIDTIDGIWICSIALYGDDTILCFLNSVTVSATGVQGDIMCRLSKHDPELLTKLVSHVTKSSESGHKIPISWRDK